MNIVIFGPPGAGKGTQSNFIVEKFKFHQLSTGELLRKEIKNRTNLGSQIESIINAGNLVSDDIVIDAVTDRLRGAESRRGFVLDGFPRNIPQAQELDTRLGWMGRPVQLVLHLAVEDDVVVKRVTGRLTCANCGAIFNKFFSPPTKRDVCDQCGSKKLEHRDDDNAKTVRARLASYERDTSPLISYYRAQHKLRTIPASGGTDGIFGAICEVVDTEIRPLDKKVVVLQESKTQMRPPAERAETSGGSDGEPAKAAKKKAAGASDKKKKKVEKKPVAKKTTKKKVTKKIAAKKKVAKKVTKKVAKKVAKKTTKKVTKKAASKKTVSKKKVAKTAQKKADKKSPPAKAAKKKATKKTAKKTAKKGRVRR